VNHHAKFLRAAVPILTKARLINIANVCEQAAEEIDRLQQHKDRTVPELNACGCVQSCEPHLLQPGERCVNLPATAGREHE
jgi:hypothetical protein